MQKGRRGTLYHVENNFGEGLNIGDIGVRKKFATGRFFFSSAGILDLIAIVLLFVAAVLFLTTSTECRKPPSWYPWLYPTMTLMSAFITIAFFILFVLGVAEENPNPWIKTALAVTMLEVTAVVVVSILAITNCDSNAVAPQTTGPLGLVGAVILAIGAAALFIMWKIRPEESDVPQSAPIAEPTEPRKSLFV